MFNSDGGRSLDGEYFHKTSEMFCSIHCFGDDVALCSFTFSAPGKM